MQNDLISTVDNVYEMLKSGRELDEKIAFSHPTKTNDKAINTSIGRIWFNLLLPAKMEFIDDTVDQKKLDQIILTISKNNTPEETSDIVSKMQQEAFKLASIKPSSYNVDSLILPDSINKQKEQLKTDSPNLTPIEYNKRATEITQSVVDHLDKTKMGVQNILKSGARGNPIDNWKALLVTKGYVVDLQQNLLGPISNSINDGYNPIDFYNGAAEGRLGFYYKAVATEKPGYLSKKISMANANMTIDDSIEDCKTKKYLNLFVDKSKANLILDRYYIDKSGKIKRIENGEETINQTIKLRSPIYCKSPKGICPICYGEHWRKLDTKNVGILAGGAVNIVYLNALMKMRHKSSQVTIGEVDFVKTINQYGLDKKLLDKYLLIEKTKITAKAPITIIIDTKNYNEETLIDSGEYFIIPGIIDMRCGIEPDFEYINTPFNFKLKLYKPTDYLEEGNTKTLNYDTGETIIQQEYFESTIDPATIDRLFEAQAKYITNPETLLMALCEKLPNVDLNHLELIISNMCRDKTDISKPCRLTTYKNIQIFGQKKLPFLGNWLSAISFENINMALKKGILEQKNGELNPIEKLVLEQYSEN